MVPILRDNNRQVVVTVWRDTIDAIDQGLAAAQWIQEFLNTEETAGCRLVRTKDSFIRETDPTYARGYQTGFADGFPFLIASTDSLSVLNDRLCEKGRSPIGMERFRPKYVSPKRVVEDV